MQMLLKKIACRRRIFLPLFLIKAAIKNAIIHEYVIILTMNLYTVPGTKEPDEFQTPNQDEFATQKKQV